MSAEVGAVKYKVELDDSGIDQEVNRAESKLSKGFGAAAKGIAAGVGTAAAGAVAMGTAAVVDLVKTAASAYGDFEQLSGGIETLFGSNADLVMQNAEKAFKTAGMSMNDYMETTIESAAAMINSLDGDQAEAARLMDMSITDMSDNVNKMGTDMEAVQNAYRGFSRGNFTMLDNLALGFAGTKEGMQELLDAAQQISGVEYDISSYSDIVEAIHVVQTEMGITGTTAEEAASTMQGSLSQMQAAWTNLTTGLANPDADIGVLIGDMVSSAETFLSNLIPIIAHALEGIATAVAELAPVLAEELPSLFENTVPVLLEQGAVCVKSLADGIIAAIPQLLPTITKMVSELAKMIVNLLPGIIQSGLQIILALVQGIAQALPELIPAAVDALMTIIDTLISPESIGQIIETGVTLLVSLITGLANAIPQLVQYVPQIIQSILTTIIQNLPTIIEGGVQVISALISGLMQAIPALLAAVPTIIMAIWDTIINTDWIDLGSKILDAVINGLNNMIPGLGDCVSGIIDTITNFFTSLPEKALDWGADMLSGFIDGVFSLVDDLWDGLCSIGEGIADFIGFSVPDKGPLSHADEWGPDFVDLFTSGITGNAYKVTDAIEDMAGDMAMGFDASVNYDMPDIAGYAKDLTASVTGTANTQIEVPVILDGREIARASAWYMGEQLAWEAR